MKVTAPAINNTNALEATRPARTSVRATEAAPKQRPAVDLKDAHGYLNNTIGDIDGLRNIKIKPGILENLMADFAVDNATKKNFTDNGTASELKSDYKKLYNSAREQQRAAQGLADSLGPGSHKMLDGSTVTVKQNKDGSTTVTTTKADGTKSVAELSSDPSKFKYTETDKNGFSTTTERDGSTVSQSTPFGSTEYSVDKNGHPVRTTKSPLGSSKTHVNEDGSTDTWRQNGCGLPTVSHEPPRWVRRFELDDKKLPVEN